MFDVEKFKNLPHQFGQYEKRLSDLRSRGIETACIEKAVGGASDNLKKAETRSFVIYGEPQSGKTEMMIALTAKLLDEGYTIVIHLLNDSLQLLEQNLERFQRSGLSPSPCNYTDILDPAVQVKGKEWVIFCKKNSRDLQKLIDKVNDIDGKVIIDDEADYATPNAKVNRGEKTRINELIETLLAKNGVYIGVTATPARLDLNNTFENDHEKWIDFPPHNKYTGQDTFFPLREKFKFGINWISDGASDEPKWCREALFSFFINVAHLNLHPEINNGQNNYSLLVHTSGKKADHKKDYQQIQRVFGVLSEPEHRDFARFVRHIWEVANSRYPGEADSITKYIIQNIGRRNIVVMNSDRDASKNYKSATSPSALFTIVIGGNIVSRGVTFDNLLSMYFTRDVKHKIQQDTYIQRARMFGARGDYLPYFELTIPEQLYLDWHRCFIFHRLSLAAIRAGNGAPVWLSDDRISSVSAPSIDDANVSIDNGEMSFGMFEYEPVRADLNDICESKEGLLEKLHRIHALLGEHAFPEFVLSYIGEFIPKGPSSIMIHPAYSIAGSKDADQTNISRRKGFMGGAAFTKNPDVTHHLRVLYNAEGRARLFYKYAGKIKFLKNLRERNTLAA